MKTAMTQFFLVIREFDKDLYATMHNEGILEIALEKEKEQILHAYEFGYKACDLDEVFEINRKYATGELYYEKRYENK